jgi:hypothetical protein
MIPTVEDILRDLAAGKLGFEQAMSWMEEHFRMAMEEASHEPEHGDGWVEQQDIPNVDARYIHHADLGRPLVTRLPDGSWWLHPGLSSPDATSGSSDG